jgi:hypothetical protein
LGASTRIAHAAVFRHAVPGVDFATGGSTRVYLLATFLCALGLQAQEKQVKKGPVARTSVNGEEMFKAY